MNRAEKMFNVAQEVVEKEKHNAGSIANGLYPNVLANIEALAKGGRYCFVYRYDGEHWRSVIERVSLMLEDDGFTCSVSGGEISIYWNLPRKERSAFTRVEEMR